MIKFWAQYKIPGKVGIIFMERPDLSNIDPIVRAYIDYLEQQLYSNKYNSHNHISIEIEKEEPVVWSEPPTPVQIISVTRNAIAKRTGRHLYSRQRQGRNGGF